MTAGVPATTHRATSVAKRDADQSHPPGGSGAHDARSDRAGAVSSGSERPDVASGSANGADSGSDSFHVGTRERPLVADGPAGPLWTPALPDASGAAGAAPHRAGHAAARPSQPTASPAQPAASERAPDPRAQRAALSTAQATKKLSKKCQKLVKTKRPSRLSKTDKKRRVKCLAQRRSLMEPSNVATPEPSSPTTGVTAPEPAIKGPAPATPTPTPTPVPGQAPTPTPTPSPSGIDPSTVPCALGVTALDVDPLKPFKMSRGVACVDEQGELAIEMVNSDRQMHNLGIRTPNQPDSLVPLLLSVPMGERDSVTANLAPGTYEIVCMVSGHGNMTVTLTVLSKADFIAQGFAG